MTVEQGRRFVELYRKSYDERTPTEREEFTKLQKIEKDFTVNESNPFCAISQMCRDPKFIEALEKNPKLWKGLDDLADKVLKIADEILQKR